MTPRAAACAAALVVLSGCMAEEARLASTYTGPPAPIFAPPFPVSDPVEVGYRLMAAGEVELALRRFEEGLLRDPRSVDALVGVGAANTRLGRLPMARRFLERAVEVAPESVAAWNNLGVVRYGLGEYLPARDALRTAFALDGGKSEEIRANLALVEHVLPQAIDADSVVTEFEMQRTGDGTFRLVDRRKPPEG